MNMTIQEVTGKTAGEYFARAGLPVNPGTDHEAAFLELVGALRLCVPEPAAADADELLALDDAARLHLPLPEARVSSPRALLRLARFQAEGCETNMRTFIGNVRTALGRPALAETEVPAGMVRDVALPRFRRSSRGPDTGDTRG